MKFSRRKLIPHFVDYRLFVSQAIVMLLLLIATGCTQYANVSAVDPLAKEYFEALKSGDLDKAMDMYSEDFFQQFPREVWREKLQRLTTELGPIKAYSFRNKQADSRFSGKFYIYQYDTIHVATHKSTPASTGEGSGGGSGEGTEKNTDDTGGKEIRAKHTITFIQSVNSPEVKLVGHRIVAPGFN